MNIKTFIKIFILLILVDLIWLKLIAEKKYKVMIKDIQGEDIKVKMLPALAVYILMALLLVLFGSTDIRNFILGFCTYGVYDMTNLTILNKFDTTFAVLDMIWGGVLFMLTYKVHKMINL
jgi:uncharacterized membrane protein